MSAQPPVADAACGDLSNDRFRRLAEADAERLSLACARMERFLADCMWSGGAPSRDKVAALVLDLRTAMDESGSCDRLREECPCSRCSE